jgi:hypothetical protein
MRLLTFNVVLLGHALPYLPHQQCTRDPDTLAHTPIPGALLSHVAGGAPGLTADKGWVCIKTDFMLLLAGCWRHKTCATVRLPSTGSLLNKGTLLTAKVSGARPIP